MNSIDSQIPQMPEVRIARLEEELADALAEIERLRAALEEISEGAGPFNNDPLIHAMNCIDAMKNLARAALRGGE